MKYREKNFLFFVDILYNSYKFTLIWECVNENAISIYDRKNCFTNW